MVKLITEEPCWLTPFVTSLHLVFADLLVKLRRALLPLIVSLPLPLPTNGAYQFTESTLVNLSTICWQMVDTLCMRLEIKFKQALMFSLLILGFWGGITSKTIQLGKEGNVFCLFLTGPVKSLKYRGKKAGDLYCKS